MPVDRNVIRNIPESTGVYVLWSGNTVIYVGKALSLKNRVRDHFSPSNDEPKELHLREKTDRIEFFVTANEAEALILERNLIKRYLPQYNIRLKDDKSFPFIKITLSEECPGAYITRELIDDGSKYFGPYASQGSIKRVLGYLRKLFGIRYCKNKIGFDSADRPCLNYQIRQCSAPCAGKIDREDYERAVSSVSLFLEGDIDRLLVELTDEMEHCSRSQNYEKAAELRDRIIDIKAISQRQRVSKALEGDLDVVGTAIRGESACIQLFIIRRGNLIGKEVFIEDVPRGSTHSEVLTVFVEQRYFGRLDIPSRIVTSHKLIDKKFIRGWLRKKKIKASLSMARSEMERDLKKLVLSNAQEKLAMELKLEKVVPALMELRSVLELEEVPERIEGIDISDISGDWAVGSLVSFFRGKPDKKNYRKFKIKAVEGIDDYAMIREVVRRRYSRLVNEGTELPNIILIDGGKGHLSSAVEELEKLFIDVPVISIAKKREEVFVPDSGGPLEIEPKSEGMSLIVQIRDEAHRFAVDYHRKLRRKRLKRSVLDEIPGIGPARRKKLIKHFGSVRKLRAASLDEITEVHSVGSSLAEEIYLFLHGSKTG